MSSRAVADTGPLVAIVRAREKAHKKCVAALKTLRTPLLTCWPVLTEAAWLLRRQYRPLDFVAEAQAAGMFDLLSLDISSLPAIAAIMRRYEDAGIQLADAALAYLAERENIRTVFTLDRRDFTIYRTTDGHALAIIPEP